MHWCQGWQRQTAPARPASAAFTGRVRPYGDADSFIAQHDIRAIGCALVDLRLGEDCGIEVFRRSRAHGHDMPVIMISGHGDIPTAVKAVQQGAMGFVEKPIDNAKLLAAFMHRAEAGPEGRHDHSRGGCAWA